MQTIAAWVAPAATMLAAMMTAANLGARVTGWGFMIFCVGSVAWLVVGVATGQRNLLVANGALLLVNAFGVWRWLGRQARYEDGGRSAARRSARVPVPSLFAAASLPGLELRGADGARLGVIVDAMMRCRGNDIAYVVVSSGGPSGFDETLRALNPDQLSIREGEASSSLDQASFERLPAIQSDRWPEAPPA